MFNLSNKFTFKFYKFTKNNAQWTHTLLSIVFLRSELQKHSRIVIPESSNNMMINTCKILDINYIVISKRTPHEIIKIIENSDMQKLQKKSLINRLNNYDDVKVNRFNGKQRRVISKILFENYNKVHGDILFDDSEFTGSTRRSLALDSLVLFYFKVKTL